MKVITFNFCFTAKTYGSAESLEVEDFLGVICTF